MGKHVFKTDLSVSGIDQLISDLNRYKRELNAKCELFTQVLADKGIMTARVCSNDGVYGRYLRFYRETSGNPSLGYRTVLIATQTGLIHREWLTKDGTKEVDVSPLLMAEFGSGQYAVAGHRGTFPEQTHAFDDTWYWQDLDHVWHASHGTVPSRPVYHAWLEMANAISITAKEVFY